MVLVPNNEKFDADAVPFQQRVLLQELIFARWVRLSLRSRTRSWTSQLHRTSQLTGTRLRPWPSPRDRIHRGGPAPAEKQKHHSARKRTRHYRHMSDHPGHDLTQHAERHLRNSQTVFRTVWAITCGTRCNCTTGTSTTMSTAAGESTGICLIATTGKSMTLKITCNCGASRR